MSDPNTTPLGAVMTLLGAAIAFVIFLTYWRGLARAQPGKSGFSPDLAPSERTDTVGGDDDPDIAATPNDARDLNPEPPPRVGLAGVHAADATFSEPAFVEEAGQLYAAVQRARLTGELGPWRERLSPGAVEDLLSGHGGLEAITEVLQDLPRIVEASQDGEWAHLEVQFTALVRERRDQEDHTLLVAERWSFSRHLADADAPWRVLRVLERSLMPLARPALERAHAVEHGSNLATVTSPHLPAAAARLQQRLGRDALAELVAQAPTVFKGVQGAWDSGDDHEITTLIDPRAAESWAFARRRLDDVGLRKRVVAVEVTDVTPARLEMETADAVATVRIRAHSREWLETLEGTLVSGVPDDVRSFSEYWTFLLSFQHGGTHWRLWRRATDEEYLG